MVDKKIKAEDIRVGMDVEFNNYGFWSRGIVTGVREFADSDMLAVRADGQDSGIILHRDDAVLVHDCSIPNEPKGFGAVVRAGAGVQAVRVSDSDDKPWYSRSRGFKWSWDELIHGEADVEVLSKGIDSAWQ